MRPRLRRRAWYGVLPLCLLAVACGRPSETGRGKGIVIRASYALDVVNFLNVLTDDPFYTKPHEQAYAEWSPRLSASARTAVRRCAQERGSNMLGPWLAYNISETSGFETVNPARFLEDSSEARSLGPVLDELETKGFREYWERERVPGIRRRIAEMERYLQNSTFSLEKETSRNVVEAMELHISQKAGLIDDPWKYLAEHDRGDHRLSVVLLECFNKWPKRGDETFATYLKGIVDRLPADLRPMYQARMAKTQVKRGS